MSNTKEDTTIVEIIKEISTIVVSIVEIFKEMSLEEKLEAEKAETQKFRDKYKNSRDVEVCYDDECPNCCPETYKQSLLYDNSTDDNSTDDNSTDNSTDDEVC